jgi:hypothetical protein
MLVFGLMSLPVAADRVITKSFDIASGGTLEVTTDIGAIEVDTHSGDGVSLTVEIIGLDDDEFEVSFNTSGDTLKVDGDKTSSSWSWGSNKVRFEISVPQQFDLNLRTAGGSIRVDDIKGKVDVKTSGGSLRFGNVEGPINGKTSGGSISIDGAKGDVMVKTSGGSLTLGDIQGDVVGRTSGGSINLGVINGEADVATSGGSIRIKEAQGRLSARTSGGSVDVSFVGQLTGDSDIATSGGSITARLPEDIKATIYARGNRIKSDFTIDGVTSAKRRLKGDINGGGAEIKLQTSSGNVYLEEK